MFPPRFYNASSDVWYCAGEMSSHYGHQPLQIVTHPINYSPSTVEVCVDQFSTLFIKESKPNSELRELLYRMVFQKMKLWGDVLAGEHTPICVQEVLDTDI